MGAMVQAAPEVARDFVYWLQRRSNVPFVHKRWGGEGYSFWRRVAVIALHAEGFSWKHIGYALDRGPGRMAELFYRVQPKDPALALAANVWPEFEKWRAAPRRWAANLVTIPPQFPMKIADIAEN